MSESQFYCKEHFSPHSEEALCHYNQEALCREEGLYSRYVEQRLFYRPLCPHNCRRAVWHNYKAPGRYLITINKNPLIAPFSTVCGELRNAANEPYCHLSASGVIIDRLIRDINLIEPFEVENHVVMPDHIHILWRVKDWLPKDFGYYVGLLKSRCSKIWREEFQQEESLFMPKFNDKISFDDVMTERFDRYISDNPRRRLTVMLHPELFNRAQQVRILDRVMDVFGNFQLLKHPIIAPAVVSSRYSPEQKRAVESLIEEAIRTQGVLVSPFISAAEKALMKRAIEEGASIIRIVADGIGPKYKPAGLEFDLCSQGRCLHIGEHRLSAHVEKKGRAEFLALNRLAHWIASHPAERMLLLGSR